MFSANHLKICSSRAIPEHEGEAIEGQDRGVLIPMTHCYLYGDEHCLLYLIDPMLT
jgi:hypothetical protein